MPPPKDPIKYQEHIKRLSDSHKGKIHSGSFKKGHKSLWNENTKKLMSLKHSKENHPNWKGGNKNLSAIKRWKLRNKEKVKEMNKLDYPKSKIRLLLKQEKIAGRKKPEQCEICGAFGRICFDHNHTTGEFRGWICTRCNSVLGFVKDNTELLMGLSEYLLK